MSTKKNDIERKSERARIIRLCQLLSSSFHLTVVDPWDSTHRVYGSKYKKKKCVNTCFSTSDLNENL